jgi:hypothetical protein
MGEWFKLEAFFTADDIDNAIAKVAEHFANIRDLGLDAPASLEYVKIHPWSYEDVPED